MVNLSVDPYARRCAILGVGGVTFAPKGRIREVDAIVSRQRGGAEERIGAAGFREPAGSQYRHHRVPRDRLVVSPVRHANAVVWSKTG